MITIKTMGAAQLEARFARRIAALADMQPILEEVATAVIYPMMAQRFASGGPGWAPLAESTVAKKGHDDILIDTGSLEASAVSAIGPYSVQEFPTPHSMFIGLNWENNGWQIPQVLSEGAGNGGRFPGRGNWSLPARPIYPVLAEIQPMVVAAFRTALSVRLL